MMLSFVQMQLSARVEVTNGTGYGFFWGETGSSTGSKQPFYIKHFILEGDADVDSESVREIKSMTFEQKIPQHHEECNRAYLSSIE